MRCAAVGHGDRIHWQDLREHQRIARPDDHRHGLQQHRDADPGDQRRQARGVAQAAVGKAFDRHRQQGADRHGQQQRQPELRQRRQSGEMRVQGVHPGKGGQRADHQNVTVGKVNNAQDAVHHGIAERDQGVDAAEHDPVDDLLYECVQLIVPTRCSNNSYHPTNELNCKIRIYSFLL